MSDKQLNISINTGTLFKAMLVVVLFAAIYFLRDIVLLVLTAVVLASATEPAIQALKRYRIGRVAAVMIVYALVILFVIGFLYFFVPPLLDELSTFLTVLPGYLEAIPLWDPATGTSSATLDSSIPESFALKDLLFDARSTVTGFSGGVIQTLSAIFGGIFGFVIIVVLSFYLAVQEDGVERFLRVITPVQHENYILDLWRRAQKKIGLWMQGQLLLGLLVGVFVYLGLTIFGVPYALLLAVLAAIFELIPVFGPILSAIPAVAIAFVEGGYSLGFAVVALYLIIQQFENHLIYPLVVNRVVGVPALLVIIALIVGAKIAGFLGVLLSVPVAAALRELVDDIQKEKEAEHKRSS